ncbi:hypothetical protein SCITRI_001967 (plasmid) [Spiroplasma citri]|uniref:hypothetical protein n=1 Tax=Spiroplasma citri TaxID=2133 RepID=UPI00090C6AD5|nr:hypothetical protein [Spiroplasma citri]APE75829.1 hypothetical protein SCITRI_001967 [Spiroplasma citri]
MCCWLSGSSGLLSSSFIIILFLQLISVVVLVAVNPIYAKSFFHLDCLLLLFYIY